MRSVLRAFLKGYSKKRLPLEGKIPAAVLVPLFEKEGETFLMLTRRGAHVRDHQNEISFPGGVFEEKDEVLSETALRESEEEMGLDRGKIEILGELDDETTRLTGYRITPFVGWLDEPHRLEINKREIEEVISLSLKNFLQPATQGPSYEIGPYFIWGATGRIIEGLATVISRL